MLNTIEVIEPEPHARLDERLLSKRFARKRSGIGHYRPISPKITT